MQPSHGCWSENNGNLPNITQKTEEASITWAFCTAADSAKNHLSSHSPPLSWPCPDYLTHFSGLDSDIMSSGLLSIQDPHCTSQAPPSCPYNIPHSSSEA